MFCRSTTVVLERVFSLKYVFLENNRSYYYVKQFFILKSAFQSPQGGCTKDKLKHT